MNTLTLDGLLRQRAEAKQAEDLAVAARRAIDDQIVEVVGTTDEGTINQVVAGKRVIVTFAMDRSVKKEGDWPELQRLWPIMPPHVQACFRAVPPEINVRQYKDLAVTDPVSYAVVAKLVTAKPTRPSIKVEDFSPE